MTSPAFTHDDYRDILRAGKAAGYAFIAFGDMNASRSGVHPSLVLRHDCDNDLVASLDLARIEADEGVRSTYFILLRSTMYNALAEPAHRLVSEILSLGHWLGLHFDERRYTSAGVDDIALRVDEERAQLAAEFGAAVDVVSFHQPGPRVLANEIRTNCINTYDRADVAGFHYLSDSNTNWKEGHPAALLTDRRYPLLQLLIHPEWWTAARCSVPDKWDAMLAHAFDMMEGSLAEREAAYGERRHIGIRRGAPLPPLAERKVDPRFASTETHRSKARATVVLEPLRDEDSPTLFAWINDRELVLRSSAFRPVSETEHAAWFSRIRNREDVVIRGIRTRDGALIGSCQLHSIDPVHRTAELQIRIGERSAQGHGAGTAALHALLAIGFGPLELQRIFLHVFSSNVAAIRAYRRVGFVEEGLLRQAANIDDRREDVIVMGILRAEFAPEGPEAS